MGALTDVFNVLALVVGILMMAATSIGIVLLVVLGLRSLIKGRRS